MSGYEYVGFWRRLLAAAIDLLILFVVTTPILLAIHVRRYFVVEYIVLAVVVIAFWRRYGATPGKMAVGAKIVDAQTGERPSTARLVVRYFAYLVSALPLFLGFLWIGVSRRKQGFHDKIARTMVIYDD
ncbi:MAG TPA: RDD family protein [Burkholderiales bacterium]|nr:RDD family protein [Burkholderiales bacterium]